MLLNVFLALMKRFHKILSVRYYKTNFVSSASFFKERGK